MRGCKRKEEGALYVLHKIIILSGLLLLHPERLFTYFVVPCEFILLFWFSTIGSNTLAGDGDVVTVLDASSATGAFD